MFILTITLKLILLSKKNNLKMTSAPNIFLSAGVFDTKQHRCNTLQTEVVLNA